MTTFTIVATDRDGTTHKIAQTNNENSANELARKLGMQYPEITVQQKT